ncbi:DUF4386 domain-containing protein (plasmid) [Hymenobacter qilianensis]|uniref:DUF4386 domain-containing protein n=1 Tax=Hymenobacter qilianensis TaxID=1385715 RepID=A0A7H0H135_9BACT|nr:DUF4386 domain-containing protein [Hymenobacter qilianensis]QNP54251.1 DUF4386 domain-containing protein [Hymenobacter qilianensis]
MMRPPHDRISLRTAALLGGLPLFVPAAPYAEFYVFKTLLVATDAAQTAQNLATHPTLFLSGIFAILFIYLYDIVLAWAMYFFLRPVQAALSLLAAGFLVVYTVLAIGALLNFLSAYQLVQGPPPPEGVNNDHVLQVVNARRYEMHIAYIIFGLYLLLKGALLYKASYIPTLLGVLIMLAGAAWILLSVQPYFFRGLTCPGCWFFPQASSFLASGYW